MRAAKEKVVEKLSGLGLCRTKVELIVDDVAAEIEERKERKEDAVESQRGAE